MTEEYKEIARRMKELALERDLPFTTPLQPTWEQELNAKLKPAERGDEVEWVW